MLLHSSNDYGYILTILNSDYETQLLENGDKRKPWISLSGDDDGNHYVLYPKTEDKVDWEYDMYLIIETGNAP